MKKTLKAFKHLIPTTWFRRLSKKKRFYLMAGVIAFFIIVIPTIIYTLTNSEKVEAAWFDGNWAYRKAINVTIPSISTEAKDIETILTIDTSTITDKMQESCQDLRFTDASGNLLPYWIDSGCGTTSTKVWILVDTVPKNTTSYTIYMYYGNPTAPTGSNQERFKLEKGLVGYWKMNESSWVNDCSTATAPDSSINENDALSCPASTGPTTPVTEHYGNSGNFDGSNDELRVSSVPVSTTTGDYTTIAFWMYWGGTGESFPMEFTNGYRLWIRSNCLGFNRGSGDCYGINPSSPSLINKWVHVTAVFYNGAMQQSKIYINGVNQELSQIVGTTASKSVATSLVIAGYLQADSYPFPGKLDDFRAYNRELSQAEITQLYTNPGNIVSVLDEISKPTINLGTEEQAPGPVAFWKFDEGQGTSVLDSTPHKTNGSITEATWQTEDQCIFGKCLKFDGSNDYISTADKDIFSPSNNPITVSFWAKVPVNAVASGNGACGGTGTYLVAKGATGQWEWGIENDNNNLFCVNMWQLDGSPHKAVSVNRTVNDGNWHYYSATIQAGTSVALYVDGILINSSSSSFNGSMGNGTQPVEIGRRGSGNYANAYIDDVKIYNYLRSAEQIKIDYVSRGSVKGVSSQIGGNNQLSSSLSQGLVGYWKMDEATWSGTLADVIDSSGNGHTGTAQGSTGAKAYPTAGKFWNGGHFDGVDDYVSITSTTALQPLKITVSAWIYPYTWSTSQAYVEPIRKESSGGYAISCTPTNCVFIIKKSDGNDLQCNVATSSIPTNSWSHLSMTYDGSRIRGFVNGNQVCTTPLEMTTRGSSASPLYLGSYGPGSIARDFPGKMDEVRIYNRALSPTEIQTLSNWAPGPRAYYSMEEGQGATINDKSGNGFNGTFTGTPNWGSGKYGKAINLNGTGAYATLGTVLPSTKAWTYSAWIKPSAASTGQDSIIGMGNNPAIRWDSLRRVSLFAGWSEAPGYKQVASSGLELNKWYYVTAVFDTSDLTNQTLKLYVNGVLVNSSTATTGTINLPSGTHLINRRDSTSNFPGSIDEARIYNYARTPGQIIEDMNASHPIGGSPIGSQVAYWKFDDGTGSTAKNSGNGGPGLNGTITNASWTNGKFGKALKFNGSNSVVNISNSALDISGDLTISSWINVETFASGKPIIRQAPAASSNYGLEINASGGLTFNWYDGSWKNAHSDGQPLNLKTWYHVGATRNGTTLTFYVDGKQYGNTKTVTAPNGSNSAVAIGYKAGQYIDALIDEVKVYNTALTSEQMKLEMNQGKSLVLSSFSDTSNLTGGSSASNSASAIYCVPGDNTSCNTPVGEWKLEEGSGTTVSDSSGRGNNGSTTGYWSSAKYGKGIQRRNSSGSLNLGNKTDYNSSSFTLELWLKVDTFHSTVLGHCFDNMIAGKESYSSSGFRYGVSRSGRVCFWTSQSGGSVNINTADGIISQGKFYHLAVTYDSSNSIGKIYVNGVEKGSDDGTYVINAAQSLQVLAGVGGVYYPENATVDDIKFFDYARTASQIAWDFNQGKPLGHWKFDECQGTIVNDSSGNKNHGTINIGATLPQTTAGTCSSPSNGTGAWYNGRSGKYNYSLNFDGVDDYITSNPSDLNLGSEFSLQAWIKAPQVRSITHQVVDKGLGTTAYGFVINTSGKVQTDIRGGSTLSVISNKTVDDDNWHHVTIVLDDTNNLGKIYIDGKLDNTGDASSIGSTNNSNSFFIGADNGNQYWFNGQIDDVRVYNYALSASQVKTTMNEGAIRWGQITGVPQ